MSTKATSKIPNSLEVTSGPSTDDEINIDTPLVKYFARFHSNSFDAKIKNSELFIGEGDLRISFRRTIRVPTQTVDDQPSRLPPDLGPFPLYNVAEFSNLPYQMRQKGGAFMPMYQREAMWIKFEAKRVFALKILLGDVNGISGMGAKPSQSIDVPNGMQDYIVVPGQPWLDGIATAPGQIKQFVAVPYGSGYSIEQQLTGRETVGGMQIQVIPLYPPLPKSWGGGRVIETPHGFRFTHGSIFDKAAIDGVPKLWGGYQIYVRTLSGRCVTVDTMRGDLIYDIKRRAENELGIPQNDFLSLIYRRRVLHDCRDLKYYNIQKESTLQFICLLRGGAETTPVMSFGAGGLIKQTIVDPGEEYSSYRHWDVDSAKTFHLHVVNAAHFEELTGIIAPDTPITMEQYASRGLPFFDIYNEKPSQIYGNFGGLKTVAELDIISQPKPSNRWGTSGSRALNKCQCNVNLLDCIIRPCNHAFCSPCTGYRQSKFCPKCGAKVDRTVSVAAPMTAPGAAEPAPQLPVKLLALDKDGIYVFIDSVEKLAYKYCRYA